MKTKSIDEYINDYYERFVGWDFSYLTSTGRLHEAPLPWSYFVIASSYMNEARVVMDLGTGGGEFFSKLPIQDKQLFATERYEPNIVLAKDKLEPLGVKVLGLNDGDDIPLLPLSLELILSRHEAFYANELYRLLKKDGIFLTQQVGSDNHKELNHIFNAKAYEYEDFNLESTVDKLRLEGFNIIYSNEVKAYTRYYDLGAILYYLKAVEWQIPNFNPNNERDGLNKLAQTIEEQGYFDATCHRFIIVAKK